MEENKQNRRRAYRLLFLNPEFQLRYSYYYAGIALVMLSVSCFFSVAFLAKSMVAPGGSDDTLGYWDYFGALLTENWPIFLGLTAAYVSAFFVFAYVLSKNIVGPMAVMTKHIDELKSGNFKHRIRHRQSDSFQPLMHALNELAENLDQKNLSVKFDKSA